MVSAVPTAHPKWPKAYRLFLEEIPQFHVLGFVVALLGELLGQFLDLHLVGVAVELASLNLSIPA
jgi:hypothetical protein